MTQYESSILSFLKGSPNTFYTRKEISRKAVRRKEYEEDPHWAVVPLAALVAQGHVETNESGLYRIKGASRDW